MGTGVLWGSCEMDKREIDNGRHTDQIVQRPALKAYVDSRA